LLFSRNINILPFFYIEITSIVLKRFHNPEEVMSTFIQGLFNQYGVIDMKVLFAQMFPVIQFLYTNPCYLKLNQPLNII
jgi:hypothetical protein